MRLSTKNIGLIVCLAPGFNGTTACSESADQNDETFGRENDMDMGGGADADSDSEGHGDPDSTADADADTDTNGDIGGDTGDEVSEGCGATDHLESGEATIDVSGTQREYILQLPDDYEPDTPYKLVFCWHWLGGSMNDVARGTIIGGPYYGLEDLANGTAIFVAPDGIDRGFANTNGRDIAFLRAMLDYFNENLCIDQKRIFSTGFSYGGMMSNAIGCAMSDVFRAIAPMSGALYSGCDNTSTHPIAVWMAHGVSDGVVPLADGQKALEVFLKKNGCGSETVLVDPRPCVAYQGCEEGYPVHACIFSGGHGPQPSFEPSGTWQFFSQF